MEDKHIAYKCDECGGISDHAKVCETPGCAKNGQPLTAYEQCENCARDSAQDGKPHVCENCRPLAG